jgi:predicted nucleic acid-binding protein
LERLAYVSDFVKSVKVRFEFPRDPRDAKFIQLAFAAEATHLVTADPDLLDLRSGCDDAASRFRHLVPLIQVVTPGDFVRRYLKTKPAA